MLTILAVVMLILSFFPPLFGKHLCGEKVRQIYDIQILLKEYERFLKNSRYLLLL